MIVYVVERHYDYEGSELEAVFSTRELADSYTAVKASNCGGDWQVREMVVDLHVNEEGDVL